MSASVTDAPTLLFDDQCGVCRRIARSVTRRASAATGVATLHVRPIGADPGDLRSLNPDLDIWDAYATIHLVMADGTMKLGGEAVAEVFRRLPSTRWFAWTFALEVFGFRPFQRLLDLGYLVLADTRPVFGCESCGTPSPWLRPFAWIVRSAKAARRWSAHPRPRPHFTGHHPV